MIVTDGDVLRLTLDINRAVALSLVAVATSITIEEVHVVNPDIRVASVERQTVVHAEHDGEVAELDTGSITT